MTRFKATLTDHTGFKKNVVIDIDYKPSSYRYDMLDSIRNYINLHYTNWKFLDFEISGGKYTMLNDPNNSIICTCRYYHNSCFTTIFNYINNGRDLVNRIII